MSKEKINDFIFETITKAGFTLTQQGFSKNIWSLGLKHPEAPQNLGKITLLPNGELVFIFSHPRLKALHKDTKKAVKLTKRITGEDFQNITGMLTLLGAEIVQEGTEFF